MFKKGKSLISIILILLALSLVIGTASAADLNDTSNTIIADGNITIDSNSQELLESNLNLEDSNTVNEAGNDNAVLSAENILSETGSGDYYVNNSVTTTGNGTIDNPYKTITEAVNNINTLTDNLSSYTVNIAPGTYTESNIEISKNISFTSYGIGEVTINGDQKQIFHTLNDTKLYNLNFINLTLTNAYAGNGSVIYVYENGNVKIINCKCENNTVMEDGAVLTIGHYYGPSENRTYISTGSILIKDSSFTNNRGLADNTYGGAIEMYKTTDFNVINSTFINNSAGAGGGAISVLYGNVNTINSTFINNSAKNAGGAICIIAGKYRINNTEFINNSAENGGAISLGYFKGENIGSGNISIRDSFFDGNKATINGGAIRLSNNGRIFNFNTIFTNNSAQKGGAISINNTGRIYSLNSTFINNTASIYSGAINIRNNGTIINNNTLFAGNSAPLGGAIHINTTANITNINSTFVSNTAGKGGAISINETGIIVNHESNFLNNSATVYGGALNIKINGTILSYDSLFAYNTAPLGGAIRMNQTSGIGEGIYNYNTIFLNNTARKGGAISINNSGSIHNDESFFINNTATEDGGAINVKDNGKIFNNNTIFSGNKALLGGGAIRINNTGKIVNKNSIFLDNNALYGGAITILENGNLTNVNTNFTSNTATVFGGAIDLKTNGSIYNRNETIFKSNTAPEGGAIHMNENALISNYLTIYLNNTATNGSGGAISIANGKVSGYRSHYFSNNATKSGGAIFIKYLGDCVNYRSNFYDNTAGNYGGAITAININATYCRFVDNKAANGSALCYGANLSANNTWWGNNTPFTGKYLISKYIDNNTCEDILLNNWVILTFTTNTTDITTSSSANLDLKFKINNNGTITDLGENKTLTLTYYYFNVTNGNINPDTGLISNNVTASYTSKVSGNQTIEAIVDNQVLNLNINVKQLTSNETVISLPFYTFVYGERNQLIGVLTDLENNTLSNRTISLNLTRYSDDAWKVYNVTTDENGVFRLPIYLSPGGYGVEASFNGDKTYTNTSTFNGMNIGNIIISTYDLKFTSNTSGNKFNGTLSLDNGTPVANAKIDIQVTSLNNGLSKTYHVISNEKGEFSLPINLDTGNYNLKTVIIYNNQINFRDNIVSIDKLSNDTRPCITNFANYFNSIEDRRISGGLFLTEDNVYLAMPDLPVIIELTRLSDGASKNYTLTTNHDGGYSLPIHLSNGEYKFRTIYTESDEYQESVYQNTFTIS